MSPAPGAVRALAARTSPADIAAVRRRLGLSAAPGEVLRHLAVPPEPRLLEAIAPAGARPDRGEHGDRLLLAGIPGGLPQRLARTWEAGGPLWLWHRSATPVADPRVAVGIVGTRRPTADGIDLARGIAADLAEVGVLVVSGLARGIDQAAHRGALEGRGLTIAVLGTGLDVDYPSGCDDLRRQIVASGALVTEHPHGAGVRTGAQFLARNRILAGLVDGVVVIEAGARSGALNTASWATSFGREVMVVPSSPSVSSAAGSLALLRDGATLVRDAADVCEALGPLDVRPMGVDPAPDTRATQPDAVPPRAPLSAGAAVVHRLLGPVGATPSRIAAASGLPVRDVMVAVAALESVGLAVRDRSGQITSASPAAAGSSGSAPAISHDPSSRCSR